MSFNGYFIKVNGSVFPNNLIAKEGYKNTPCQRTDKNSYVDGSGELRRSILPVKRSTVKVTTNELKYGEKIIVQAFFIPRDTVTMEYWNDETNNYETAVFYVPDIEYTVKCLDQNKKPIYLGLELTFIAYGGDK